jgi:hypothetical protein
VEATGQAVRLRRRLQDRQSRPEHRDSWSYLGEGLWRRECVCTYESISEPFVDDRVKNDPLDLKTARHLGQCEYISETDPAMLKVLLKVKEGGGGTYGGWSAAGAAPAGRFRTTPRASGDNEPADSLGQAALPRPGIVCGALPSKAGELDGRLAVLRGPPGGRAERPPGHRDVS